MPLFHLPNSLIKSFLLCFINFLIVQVNVVREIRLAVGLSNSGQKFLDVHLETKLKENAWHKSI